MEYLITRISSLPQAKFGSRAVTVYDIKKFFKEIRDLLDDTFGQQEDFEGFEQNKLIPLFWNGQRYYFFYSLDDRPYERWKEITEAFSSPELCKISDFDRVQIGLMRSLQWQTELLLGIKSLEESTHKQENIYVPSQDFIDHVSVYFRQTEASFLYPKEMYIMLGRNHFFIYPQAHLEILSEKATEIITENSHHCEAFKEEFRNRLGRVSMTVFKKPYLVYRLLAETHWEDFLDDIADFAFYIDLNKVVIFKALNFGRRKKVNEDINQLITRIQLSLGGICKERAVGIYRAKEERMRAVYTEHIKIYVVLVYEAFDPAFTIFPKKNKDWKNVWLFSMMDIKIILENLNTPIDFLKFLQEEKYLLSHVVLIGNRQFHDRFAWFLLNKHCYIAIGSDKKRIYFPQHTWGIEYAAELFNKLNNNLDVYLEVESRFPSMFSDVKKYTDNVYSLSDPVNLEILYLARLSDRFIWIYLPDHPLNLSYEEYSKCSELFGPMFGDYLARFDKSVSTLLDEQEIKEFDILIAPLGFLEKERKFFSFLDKYISDINENNPYNFVSLPVGIRHVRTFFIFDYRYSYKIFDSSQNQGERNLMLNFLKSIAYVVGKQTKSKFDLLTEIIDRTIPQGKKGYGVDQLTVDNPDIEKYGVPYEPTLTDEGVARRTVATFIRKHGIASGIHKGATAKALLKKVFDYLQKLLDQEIARYDEGFVVFAYQQLEKNEGQIERRKLKAGMQATRRLNFSPLHSLKVGMQRDSWLTSSIRLLIHTALKKGMKGKRAPTQMEWTYLLGLSFETLLAATNYEYINHNLLDIEIRIDENYRIEITDQMIAVDFSSFSHKDSEKKYSYAIHAFEKAVAGTAKSTNNEEAATDKEGEIDRAFLMQFGISYSKITLVLYILSKMELPPPTEFPVYIMEKETLITQILSHVIIDIDRDEIDRTINFLTLEEGMFPADKFLYFGAMLRSKERITVSPFIKLRDGSLMFGRECLDSCLMIWADVFYGNLPFGVQQNSDVDKVMKIIKNERGVWLEKKAEQAAVAALGHPFVEARIDNFKRLSDTFKRRESCGEIDLLCVSPLIKTIFIFDCKNLVRLYGLYQAKKNVDEFFVGHKSYYQKLTKKKKFIEDRLEKVLEHFDIPIAEGWTVREGFIVTKVYFAAFVSGVQVDFVDVDQLSHYILQSDQH